MDDQHEGRRGMTIWAEAVIVDFAANAISLRVPGLPGNHPGEGTLDVGANGRLLGLEVGETYVQVMPSVEEDESYIRSADVRLDISSDESPVITIPRRGPAYEISYPSGNECWQVTTVDGELIQVCATTGD